MDKPRILLQLDSDPQPSVFDGVVAIDAGVEQIFRHGGVTPENVRELVYGAIFTRGGDDLRRTAIFVGGANVSQGEQVLAAVKNLFFGPMRVSVMIDSNGANTTAAAAVLAAAKHLKLAGATALVLGGTGPVGQRMARLLAKEGAHVRVGSRRLANAAEVCEALGQTIERANLIPVATAAERELTAAFAGVQLVIAAGAAGAVLVSRAAYDAAVNAGTLQVAIDLNAVPPRGIEAIAATDRAEVRGAVVCYGALGVGGTKMKIHKEAIRALFEANDRVLDAEEIFAIGQRLSATG
ncbi:MAG TPA: NAD(P)-dependent methylenetetrahydromethanopterin dehydrogenase [Pirellulales bacterium]|jgi:nucleoside phosphorylase|nr:NAD(P)-dependent methylenetetrahydromethanopterin dehydrogenase [Pirellulales bacterium]